MQGTTLEPMSLWMHTVHGLVLLLGASTSFRTTGDILEFKVLVVSDQSECYGLFTRAEWLDACALVASPA